MTPYASATDAVTGIWSAGWPAPDGVPVLWHHNTSDPAPSRAAGTKHWLHVAVEFMGERIVAYGGGLGSNERELDGAVVIRVLAARGIGDATQLQLLDQALAVFRGVRVEPLTFIGEAAQPSPGATDDGAWWVRSAITAFVYRFRG